MEATLMIVMVLSPLLYASAQGWQHDGVNTAEGSTCSLKTGGNGVCTRIDMCEAVVKREIKYANLNRCFFIQSTEVICCPKSKKPKTTQPTPTTATVSVVATRSKEDRPSLAACEKYKAENPSAIVYHILDGKEASPGDFPYIGGMLYRSEKAGTQYDLNCGCSLISETFAITAAHCVPEWPLLVRFGAVDWNPPDNLTYRYDAKIKNIIVHDDYVSFSYYNDIALIEFTEPVQISGFVAPICLHTEIGDIDSSTLLKVAGWGITNIETRSTSQILLSTNITTVELSTCNATHIANGVSRKYSRGLIDSQYCAYDPLFKKDSCSGDSGGPLVVTTGNSTELVGIVSFGNACGSILPSVYTRVAYYLDWIEQRVWPTATGV